MAVGCQTTRDCRKLWGMQWGDSMAAHLLCQVSAACNLPATQTTLPRRGGSPSTHTLTAATTTTTRTTATTLVLLVGPREARPSQGSNTLPFYCTRNCTRLKTLRHQKQRLLGPLLDSSASKRVAPTGQPTKSLYNSCDMLQPHPTQHLCVQDNTNAMPRGQQPTG